MQGRVECTGRVLPLRKTRSLEKRKGRHVLRLQLLMTTCFWVL